MSNALHVRMVLNLKYYVNEIMKNILLETYYFVCIGLEIIVD